MEDQIRFELIVERTRIVNVRLKLFGPLSPSSDGWDNVGSSNCSGVMVDRPSDEVTS